MNLSLFEPKLNECHEKVLEDFDRIMLYGGKDENEFDLLFDEYLSIDDILDDFTTIEHQIFYQLITFGDKLWDQDVYTDYISLDDSDGTSHLFNVFRDEYGQEIDATVDAQLYYPEIKNEHDLKDMLMINIRNKLAEVLLENEYENERIEFICTRIQTLKRPSRDKKSISSAFLC